MTPDQDRVRAWVISRGGKAGSRYDHQVITWHRRLAAMDGVGYSGQPGIDRETLPGHDARPQTHAFVFDAKRTESLVWGETSESPASRHSHHRGAEELSIEELLKRLYEALELPGTPSDYHFILMEAYRTLWARRNDSADCIDALENLCLLDIRLVEAAPEAIQYEADGITRSFSIPAFGIVADLYERNGYPEDALRIHRRGALLGQGDGDVARLEERIRKLRAEDGE